MSNTMKNALDNLELRNGFYKRMKAVLNGMYGTLEESDKTREWVQLEYRDPANRTAVWATLHFKDEVLDGIFFGFGSCSSDEWEGALVKYVNGSVTDALEAAEEAGLMVFLAVRDHSEGTTKITQAGGPEFATMGAAIKDSKFWGFLSTNELSGASDD